MNTKWTNYKNQIDYVIQRFRYYIKYVKTYPEEDIHSDHVLLMAKVKLQLKKMQQYKRSDIQKFKEDDTKKDKTQTEQKNIRV